MPKGFTEREKELIRKRLAAFCLGEVEIQLHKPISPALDSEYGSLL